MSSVHVSQKRRHKGDEHDRVRSALEAVDAKSHQGREMLEKLKQDDRLLSSVVQKVMNNVDHSIIVTDLLEELFKETAADIFFGADALSLFDIIKKECPSKNEVWRKVTEKDITNMPFDFQMESIARSDFFENSAAWTKNPKVALLPIFEDARREQKQPIYAAFSGASGSGKTFAMIWTWYKVVKPRVSARDSETSLTLYLSCRPKREHTDPFEYADYSLNEKVSRLSRPLKLSDLKEQCAKTWLILILDEVPWEWTHESYCSVPGWLKEKYGFKRVVMLVGGTALNHDVRRQPTSASQVVNIRMKPLAEKQMPDLLKTHLSKLCIEGDKIAGRLLKEIPFLVDLMTNHRCAKLTAETLCTLLGNMDDIPTGWCRGHSLALLSMVSNGYRNLNGLKDLSPKSCREIMLQSIALIAVQPVKSDERVEMDPDYLEPTRGLVECGLVERAILHDMALEDDKVALDGCFEWQMSPALTLLCATTILPWLEGIHQAPDHFEALVAVMMVAMRYAQTGKEYSIRCMDKSIPYQGNESHLFHEPLEEVEDMCLINGPQAPYSDLMVSKVSEGLTKPPNGSLLDYLSGCALEGGIPVSSLLVQCKLKSIEEKEVKVLARDELAKMGFFSEKGQLCSPVDNPFESETKQFKQYAAGRWLTSTHFKQASVIFASNGPIDCDRAGIVFMEGTQESEWAWQCVYPVIHLARDPEQTMGDDVMWRRSVSH